MRFHRILPLAAIATCAALVASALPAWAEAPSLPQPVSARAGGTWLAGQFTSQGYIPSSSDPDTADLSATANSILALASSNVDPSLSATALSYMEQNVDSYLKQYGADGPGQLAILILDAHALGEDPHSFGGVDLVSALLATEQTSGKNKGLFGTDRQVKNYDAGVYNQGLSLAALDAVGETRGSVITSAESWLLDQQCPDGGWTSYESTANPCTGLPANFKGPDTNSTALAIDGLSAQGDLPGSRSTKAVDFLVQAEDGDGGWGYEPNSKKAPGSTDPDSTALVIQAIRALGDSPSHSPFAKHGDPVSVLESFQVTTGENAGSFTYPGISGPNLLATYQAVPAVAGVLFPFNLYVKTSSLPTATVGHCYSANLTASGGNPPYSWSLAPGAGTLPPGLTLSGSGEISGIPTTSGTSTFVVVVTDTETTTEPRHDNVGWAFLSISTSSDGS
jgi:Putative Ig domain/Squalene-hopene cyclase C-terminal domain